MTAAPSLLQGLIRQFATFCGVGVLNTALGLAVILFLSEILAVHYGVANMIGYGVGLMVGFVLHKNITFCKTSADRPTRTQVFQFLAVFAIAYPLQFGALVFMVGMLGWPNLTSQIFAVGVYTVISFAGNKLLTFRGKPTEI